MAYKEGSQDNSLEQVKPENGSKIAVVNSSPPWPLITIGVFATLVIVATVVGGWAFIASHRDDRAIGRYGMSGQFALRGNDGPMSRRGLRHSAGGMTQQAAARGVITVINGDTVTVSGLGRQTTIKKSSTTSISGDKTNIAVNDTVAVYGTANSDGSVAATRIVVNNQSNGTKAAIDPSDDTSTSGL